MRICFTRAAHSYKNYQLRSSVTTQCAYWVHVSNMVDTVGVKKYQHLSFVAKAAFNLSHINTSPERGFSVNNALVTTDRRSLSDRSIVTVHVVKEAVCVCGSCTKVRITTDLMHSVRHAYSDYALFLENERKQALVEDCLLYTSDAADE